ncbi:DUF3800 domain-containing protein [Dongia sp.]|uniref:DUF3800 domain-containing protein n=1 Tax=Dongia sp. TaxID=1977262 RepID=UPI0035B1EB57
MPSKTLYFDESGFTGSNLLDPNQPIFVISSTSIDSESSEKMLRTSFPNYQAAEFKFANIWRSGSKRRLIDLAGQLKEYEDQIFTWMIDKRFAVLTKVVDFLIEPLLTDSGYDFYADGFAWKYSNHIHVGLTYFAPPELYETLLNAYQTFSRNPTPKALQDLQSMLGIMATSVNDDVKPFFEQMHLGALLFEKFHSLDAFKGSNELHFTSMLASVAFWRQRHPEDFEIVHDASANFFRQKEVWEQVTNSDVEPYLHPLGDGTSVQFPLRVTQTTPINSENSYAIQLCDVLAGLAARHFDKSISAQDRELINAVLQSGLANLTFNGIRPADEPVEGSLIPKRLNGPDAVDLLTRILHPKDSSPKI